MVSNLISSFSAVVSISLCRCLSPSTSLVDLFSFHRYDPDAITTKDGNLEITLTQEPWNGLNFRSGMLQSWNKVRLLSLRFESTKFTFSSSSSFASPAVHPASSRPLRLPC